MGKGLAYLEISLAVARVVWCMDFRAADTVEERGLSLGWKGMQGPMLQFRRREGVEL